MSHTANVWQSLPHRWSARGAIVLVGLLLAVLAVVDVPVEHDHDAPGLYDLECPLARLAVATPRLSLGSIALLAPLEPTFELALAFDPGEFTDVRRASFDARAPPIRT
jgi:hypothetical protein